MDIVDVSFVAYERCEHCHAAVRRGYYATRPGDGFRLAFVCGVMCATALTPTPGICLDTYIDRRTRDEPQDHTHQDRRRRAGSH